MDKNGITQSAYSVVYKKFKGAAKLADKGLQIGCLPNPNSVTKVRQMLNLKLRDYIGDYKFINDTLQVPTSKGSKMKDPVTVKLNDFNSLFADVEQVQRTMVQLYGITTASNCYSITIQFMVAYHRNYIVGLCWLLWV